jgi:microcystin-dependent protein
MAEPYIGEIRMGGWNFAPENWAPCGGQLLPISEYSALFALIGTTYGGDGVNTFALPNLLGRVPVHQGQGTGLSPYVLGQPGGSESVTLSSQQIPSHTHAAKASANAGSTATPGAGVVLATPSTPIPVYAPPGTPAPLSGASVQNTGNSQPHENRQPLQAVTYVIALFGVFPTQN